MRRSRDRTGVNDRSDDLDTNPPATGTGDSRRPNMEMLMFDALEDILDRIADMSGTEWAVSIAVGVTLTAGIPLIVWLVAG